MGSCRAEGRLCERCPYPVRHQQIALTSDDLPAPLKPRNSDTSAENSSSNGRGSPPVSTQWRWSPRKRWAMTRRRADSERACDCKKSLGPLLPEPTVAPSTSKQRVGVG